MKETIHENEMMLYEIVVNSSIYMNVKTTKITEIT